MIESSMIYGSEWDESELRELNYISALYRKKLAAEEVLANLLTKPYAENNDLINEVVKAIKFNQELIDNTMKRK